MKNFCAFYRRSANNLSTGRFKKLVVERPVIMLSCSLLFSRKTESAFTDENSSTQAEKEQRPINYSTEEEHPTGRGSLF